ncbi:MAG: fibronectin type III-like domain-contianing protein, partial [Clostridia bacterium]|nr:fibronectin type III-like domain-contianing protein [Clostridia bacterium]
FAKVFLKAGESKLVTVKLDKRAFAYYHVNEKDFVCDDGKYIIMAGASVADIRLDTEISLNGFGTHENPYSDEVNMLYNNAEVANLSRSEFCKLLGRELKVEKPGKPYTWDSCFGDTTGTKYGDIINSVIDFICPKMTTSISSSDMVYYGAIETPIRTLVSLSNGVITEGLGNALVDMMNEKPGSIAKVAGNGILTGINAIKRSK